MAPGARRMARRCHLARKRQASATIAPRSVHAVTVPGAVDAWARLLERHGTIDLKRGARAGHPSCRGRRAGRPRASPWTGPMTMKRLLADDEGGSCTTSMDGQRARGGRCHALSGPCQHLAAHRREGPRRLLSRARSPRTSSRISPGAAAFSPAMTSPRTEATWVEPISTIFAGHRDPRNPAQRARHHRAHRAQHPRRASISAKLWRRQSPSAAISRSRR